MNGVVQIKYVDCIDVIALFLICGIGADCLFIIFELFRQSRVIYGSRNKKRLAYAAQRGMIALATSISTSGVSFLALLTSGVRVMNFFGVFSFLLLFFTFVMTFTWYLAILAIWARYFEPKNPANPLDTVDVALVTPSQESSTTSSSVDLVSIPYPYESVFAFLSHRPIFNIDAANIDISKYNFYEQFVYNYLAPVLYFYRLPIILFFLIWATVFGYFAFQMGTKSQLVFLSDFHPLQRAYVLSLNGFSTALNDFSFVFVWGIKPKPVVTFAQHLTVDDYGTAEYWPFDITNPLVQEHINWTWQYIRQRSDIIDVETTKNFGASPWDYWRPIFDLDDSTIGWWINLLIESLGMPALPTGPFPISAEEYHSYGFLWQLVLSYLLYQEPDSYVPGTLKANTVGFSFDDYSLQYIGMKANMWIPKDLSVQNMRRLFANASGIEDAINAHAAAIGIPEFKGWMTSVAWLTMITEEELPHQVIKDVGVSFAFAAIVILFSTLSLLYTIYVIISMVSTLLIVLGILYFTGWKIGCNEAIMISIASGFCADFIIQPMIALSHDFTGRSIYGKIQASLVTFCTPVSCALITTLVAAAFLYPCEILLFPPFASFLLGSGVFGIIHGFIVLPAWIGLFSRNRRSWIPEEITRLFRKDQAPGYPPALAGPSSNLFSEDQA
jgi:hypothetical protein